MPASIRFSNAVLALSAALPLPAQDQRAADAPPTPAEMVAAAEDAIRAERPEDATIWLWRASFAVDPAADDAVSEGLRRTIRELLARFDPRYPELVAARTEVAEAFVKCAQAYARKRWYRTASDAIDLAGRWDRDAAAKVRAYVDKQVAKLERAAEEARDEAAAESAAGVPAAPAIGALEPFFDDIGWQVRDGVLFSPPIGDGGPAAETKRFFCREPLLEDVRIRFETRIGPVPGAAALAIGVRDWNDYFLVELRHDEDGRSRGLQVAQLEPDAKEAPTLGAAWTTFAGFRKNEFATVTVDVRGDELTCSVDGEPGMRVKLPRPAHGGYGFFVTGNSPKKTPVEFRNLEFLPLPPPPADSAEAIAAARAVAAARQEAVLEAIREAEATIEAGDAEDGVRALRNLRGELDDIASELLRRAMRSQVETVANRHDPCSTERAAAHRAAAAALAGLAAEHAKLGRDFAALELSRLADDYVSGYAAARLAALEDKVAAVLRKQRGVPAEPHQDDDNAQLVATFAGGRRYWSNGAWAIGPTGALSPPLPKGSVALLLADPDVVEAPVASVQMACRAGDGTGGLVFGVTGSSDFWLLNVVHGREQSRIRVLHFYGDDWHPVVTREVRFSPEARAGFLTLAVWCGDDSVRCQVGPDEAFMVPTKKPLPGRYGLLAESFDGSTEAVTIAFRNFRNAFPNFPAVDAAFPAAERDR